MGKRSFKNKIRILALIAGMIAAVAVTVSALDGCDFILLPNFMPAFSWLLINPIS